MWVYELKLDGYRAEAIKTKGRVHLRSRNDKDFNARYPAIVQALAAMPDETMIEGEVVAVDESGRPSFSALQNGSSTARLLYYVFDVSGVDSRMVRLAIHPADIAAFNPPLQPIKATDSRAGSFRRRFGSDAATVDLMPCRRPPEMIQYTLERFEQELQKRLTEIQKLAAESTQIAVLHTRRVEFQAQVARLADAIAAAGHSPALLSRRVSAEADLARVTQGIEQRRPVTLRRASRRSRVLSPRT